ncbi:hypothetical protein ACU8KH_01746 [Lachancea thermotolerans]
MYFSMKDTLKYTACRNSLSLTDASLEKAEDQGSNSRKTFMVTTSPAIHGLINLCGDLRTSKSTPIRN